MAFFLLALIFMFVGRKLGWALSKSLLYTAPLFIALVLATLWGGLVAFGMRELLNWQQPGAILRWLMGYALGAYVAVPNYGLLVPPTIPDKATSRHDLVLNVPAVVYIGASIAFAYLLPYD